MPQSPRSGRWWTFLFMGALACGSDSTKEASSGAEGADTPVPAPDSGTPPVEDSGEPPPTDVDGTLALAGALEPLTDSLAVDILDAHPLNSASLLIVNTDGVHILDETDGTPVSLYAAQTAGGVSLDATSHLVLLDAQVMVWDGTWLRASPLQDAMPLPAESVVGHAEHLWMLGGGELYHHTEGTLSAVTIDGESDIRMLAAGPESLCAVMAPFLMVLDGFGGAVSLVDYQPDRAATSMTFDADGDLWLSDGTSRVARRTAGGDWGSVQADEDILAVYGHPSAEDVWLQTAEGAIHHHNGRFHTVEVPTGDWLGVDPLGRLLVLGSDGLTRVSTRRAVAVSGLLPHSQLDTAATLAFAPTGADSLISLDVWVGTEQLTLDPDLGTTELDPVALPPGDHILRMAAVGPEGTTVTDLPFRTGELPDASWDDDIEPIMQEHCSRCHGDAAAIPLHTADLWRLNIDRILSEVVSQDMPLGGPYLSDDELELVRGWQAGGFQ